MKKFKIYLATIIALVCSGTALLAISAPVNAGLFDSSKDQACNGANLQDSGGCTTTTDTSNKVTDTLRSVLNILSFVVGVVAVIMLIIGGIRFITSQGDSGSTALARNTIIYALVGIVIAAIAQLLVQFVIGRATKVPTPTPTPNPKVSVIIRQSTTP